ncbi:hypothetical protein SGLAM104S_05930 [Streptomyces glaucescens]
MTTYTTTVHGLATDVRLPDGPGPFPTVLVRTPYDRRAHRAELRGWAARGFAAVAQDVRGRFASPGEWRPYEGEAADGAETARWIRVPVLGRRARRLGRPGRRRRAPRPGALPLTRARKPPVPRRRAAPAFGVRSTPPGARVQVWL